MYSGWFYPPWPEDAKYPRALLERHMALCRYFDLPEATHPNDLPEPTPEAVSFAEAAVRRSDEMFAWSPGDHLHDVDPFAGLYDPPGHFDHYALHGGRGGAKSTEIAKAIVFHARSRREVIVCARQFQNSIDASSKTIIEQQIRAAGAEAEFSITDQSIEHKGTGSTFDFVGLERNIASVKSRDGITLFWIEEAETIKLASMRVLLPTVRNLGSRFFWSWNPDREESPVDRLFRQGDPPERSRIFGVNVEHNRWLYRTRMPSEMRSHWNKDRTTFKHVWRGDYNRNSEAAIFMNLHQGYLAVPDGIRPRYGMDFGHRDPQVLTRSFYIPAERLGLDPEHHRDVLYVTDEAYETGAQIVHLPTFMERVPGGRSHPIKCDSHRPDMIETLQRLGYDAQPCKKGPGSIVAGLNFLAGLDIVVAPDCPHTFAELQSLRWKTDEAGQVLNTPEAGNDHCIDTLRYAHEDARYGDTQAAEEVLWL